MAEFYTPKALKGKSNASVTHHSDESRLSSIVEKIPDTTFQKIILHENVADFEKNKILTVTDKIRIRSGFYSPPELITANRQDLTNVVTKRLEYHFSGKTLLAVDDVVFNLNLIEMFFRNTGIKILFAENGSKALDLCISNPDIDIVLMDIQMPVMNGFEATREIRKHRPHMPVIAITAFVNSEDRQRCFEAGCNEFMPKPCKREDVLKMVNNFF